MTEEKKILYVDDDPIMANIIYMAIRKLGNVTSKYNFNEAAIINVSTYNLLLLDGDLQGNGHGFETGQSGPDLYIHWQNALLIEPKDMPPVAYITNDVNKVKKRLETLGIYSEDTLIFDKGEYDVLIWREKLSNLMEQHL